MEQGFAIIIAWPETLCKQAGAWYDSIIQPIGFGTNGYYQVGHAAIVLINKEGKCSYYDFGRYHSPHGKGRVRGSNTDHDLLIKTKIGFDENGQPLLVELFNELNNNPSCHGEGELRAGILPVSFNSCLDYIHKLQQKDYIPYGPFTKSGTNCSRFVRSIARVGTNNRAQKIKLSLAWMLTPSPIWNVKTVGEYVIENDTAIENVNSEYEIA